MQMETVTTGTVVHYFVMAATPSGLFVFQGTTSLEVNSCLPLGILCAHSLFCLTPCLQPLVVRTCGKSGEMKMD